MVNYLAAVSWMSIVLLVGIIISAVCTKIRFPEILFLMLLGMVITRLDTSGYISYNLPTDLLISFSIFALVMIVFEGASHFKVKELSAISPYAFRITAVFLVFCLVFLSMATFLLFLVGKGSF